MASILEQAGLHLQLPCLEATIKELASTSNLILFGDKVRSARTLLDHFLSRVHEKENKKTYRFSLHTFLHSLKHLDKSSLVRCRRVCKEWHNCLAGSCAKPLFRGILKRTFNGAWFRFIGLKSQFAVVERPKETIFDDKPNTLSVLNKEGKMVCVLCPADQATSVQDMHGKILEHRTGPWRKRGLASSEEKVVCFTERNELVILDPTHPPADYIPILNIGTERPRGVALDADKIYLLFANGIQVRDLNGGFFRDFKLNEDLSSSSRLLVSCRNIIVLDAKKATVILYSKTLVHQATWSFEQQKPLGLMVWGACVDQEKEILYIVDNFEGRVRGYNFLGKKVMETACFPESNFADAVFLDGELYVNDWTTSRILTFEP